jgi:hypothetical protein
MSSDENNNSLDKQIKRIKTYREKVGKFIPEDDGLSIIILYGVAIVFWTVVILFLGFFFGSSWISKAILLIPIVIFIINMLVGFDEEAVTKAASTQGNIITFFFIISGVIISWRNPSKDQKNTEYHKKFILALLVAFFFLVLLNVEIAILVNHPEFNTHFDLILISFTLTLLGYTLSEFFYVEYTDL